jgi:transcriptional regulator with XRE-family HTH domain
MVLTLPAQRPSWRSVSDIGKRIGERIRDLRSHQVQPWTQKELAAKARISVSYLSMMERGQRVPPMHTLAALAQALNVPVAELLSSIDRWSEDSTEVARPLSDFIQRRHLSPRDVERLLYVARLMFNQHDS